MYGHAGSALQRLDVSDNPMTGEAAPALAQMLGRHPELRALNLSDTALGDDGGGAGAVTLRRQPAGERAC